MPPTRRPGSPPWRPCPKSSPAACGDRAYQKTKNVVYDGMRIAVLAFSLVLLAAGQPATAASTSPLRPLWTVSAGPEERQITGVAVTGRTLVRASTLYRGYEHPTGELRRYDA